MALGVLLALSLAITADPYADQIIALAGDVASVTYSMSSTTAHVSVIKATYNIWETIIEVNTPLGPLTLITTLIGRNNVYNVLAAVAAGLAMSIPLKVTHHSHTNLPVTYLCCHLAFCLFGIWAL